MDNERIDAICSSLRNVSLWLLAPKFCRIFFAFYGRSFGEYPLLQYILNSVFTPPPPTAFFDFSLYSYKSMIYWTSSLFRYLKYSIHNTLWIGTSSCCRILPCMLHASQHIFSFCCQVIKSGRSKSKRALYTLIRDIAAVASGIRPAFLIDYGLVLAPQELAAAVDIVVQNLSASTTVPSRKVCIFELDQTLLVASIDDLCCHEYGLSQRHRNFMLFKTHSVSGQGQDYVCKKVLRVCWATETERSEIQDSVRKLGLELRDLVQRRSTVTTEPVVTVLDLSSQREHEAMDGKTILTRFGLSPPTFYGCILGYPAVYIVSDQTSALTASRLLSSKHLLIRQFYSGMNLGPRRPVRDEILPPLFSFSIPVCLDDDASWRPVYEKWYNCLKARQDSIEEEAVAWDTVQCNENRGTHAVVI